MNHRRDSPVYLASQGTLEALFNLRIKHNVSIQRTTLQNNRRIINLHSGVKLMKTVPVLIKRSNQRNIRTTATCDPRNGASVSHVMDRPNVRRSMRSTAAFSVRS